MESLLKDLKGVLAFLRTPIRYDSAKHPLQQAIPFYLFQMLLTMIVIQLVIGFIIGFPIELLSGVNSRELERAGFKELLQERGPLLFFMLGCIVAPLLEETTFRLGLSFKRLHVAVSLGAIAFTIMHLIYQHIPLSLAVGLVTIGIFYLILKGEQLQQLRQRFGNIIIYIMLIAFPLMHIPNITLPDLSYWYVYVPYLLSLFVSSVIFCFVRLRAGFFPAVVLHAVGNAIAIIPLILSYYLKTLQG